MMTPDKNSTTHFGFQTVSYDQKQNLVDQVFDKSAARYDLMNDLMSGGLHRLWKEAAVSWLSPPKGETSYRVLDVAGGTADIAQRIIDSSGPNVRVDVLDINHNMLFEGMEKISNRGELDKISFTCGNGEILPFDDKTFDAYTIAFGIRNIPDINEALREAYRVLKPGGRLMVLEFSHVSIPMLDKVYDLYSFNAIPLMGRLVSGDAESYRYLVESIRNFPKQRQFLDMIQDAGFKLGQYRNLSGGIVAIHSAWRI